MQIRASQEFHQNNPINKSMHENEKNEFSNNTGTILDPETRGAKQDGGGDGTTAMDVDDEDEVTAKENGGDIEMRDPEKAESRNGIDSTADSAAATVQDMDVDDVGGDNNRRPVEDETSKNKIPKINTKSTGSSRDSSASVTGNNADHAKDSSSDRGSTKTENRENGAEPASGSNESSNPPPPVMKGTLSSDVNGQQRRHLIRGMWNYENSNAFAPQRFELVRTLASNEDENTLPLDGEFHGSFSLTYVTTTSKGKRKERSKVVSETGVKIKFTKTNSDEYSMEGRGANQYGSFRIFGSAKPTADPSDPTMSIMFRKIYEPAPNPPEKEIKKESNGTKKKAEAETAEAGPLPDPSESFQRGVVCLRGKLIKDDTHELGATDVVHRISGLWAQGLDFILSDLENTKGLCHRFEYEHKSSVPSNQFPVSGKYSGWFDFLDEDGTMKRINERDVTLKFKKNNAGYHNVEGKGSNVFGKYTITGNFTSDQILTIFRHFQQRKIKTKPSQTAAVPLVPTSASIAAPRRPAEVQGEEPKLKLADVEIADDGMDKSFDPIVPPDIGTYSAVSRGVLRVDADGSHSCQGKWASTRELYTTGQTLPMTFRLESHHAADSARANAPNLFPLDSMMYKGSFQMKKGARGAQTIVDQQIVMKFRKNNQGAYNVHGKGINSIGEFNLIGSLIFQGTSAGQVELYRVYPPSKLLAAASAAAAAPTDKPNESIPPAVAARGPNQQGLSRRESSRTVKAPLWLEEDDPSAQISRTLDKCGQILKFLRDKDVEFGAFFGQPVDPIAMRIPTYFQVVKEPMDLKTVARKMEAGTVATPEEFRRLVTLVFENAITFNIDPNHSVHQAARRLLTIFNQKYRDVERSIDAIRRTHGVDVDFDKGGKPGKAGNKRLRGDEPPKSMKRIRLDEAQKMAAANAHALTAIVQAAPSTATTTVTRSEFNMLLTLIQQIQTQVVETHKALAELSPDNTTNEKPRGAPIPAAKRSSTTPPKKSAPASKADKPTKKAPARRTGAAVVAERVGPVAAPAPAPDDLKPLTVEEQTLLTETINELPQEHLPEVMQIIKEGASIEDEEDEIDLEIDQLDIKTQRKLLRHVLKKPKKQKKPKQQPMKKKPEKPQPEEKATSVPAPPKKTEKTTESSFFAFGGDSESDEEDEPTPAPAASANEFKLDSLEIEDDEEEIEEDNIAVNWNFKKDSTKKEGDDDDDWGAAAREQAAAAKARDEDRKAREEKKKADAEQASKERLKDAAARGEEIKAQRAEEQAREASLREEKEKEAIAAREAAKKEAQAKLASVEQTVDLDLQRTLMDQYGLSDTGGASPSGSDFGF